MTNSNSNNTNLKEQDNIDDEVVNDVIDTMMNGGGARREDNSTDMLVQQFITNIIENASKRLSDGSGEVEIEIEREQKPEVVFRGRSENFGESINGNKRMSLDEELMYQLEDVDKKVNFFIHHTNCI